MDKYKEESGLLDNNEGLSKLLFDVKPLDKKPIELTFTAEKVSSDGGLLLLREVENHIGIVSALTDCIDDTRHPGYIQHTVVSMLTQRVFQIAAGYEDANDSSTLRDDHILKICSGKAPEHGKPLSSQPTMCRFENTPASKALYKMGVAFVDHFINSYPEAPDVIMLDCDDTDYVTHGTQQLALYNDYYGEYCYMPLHIYEGFSGKIVATLLKPGRRSKTADVFSILQRLINHLRQVWKNTIIIVRGDGHFCSKELMAWTESQRKLHYLTGLTGNKILNNLANVTIESAKNQFRQTGIAVKRYHSFYYAAASWHKPQRVIVKVEVSSKGLNIRYIVTDIEFIRTKALYENAYCARGQMELYIKEHKTYLKSDKMSCSSFAANQFRLFLHSAAYVLIHALRSEVLANTEYATASMKTIQLRLIKVAAYVKEMKTRIRVEFPKQFPDLNVIASCLRKFELLRC
jgi:hypothetical protein